MFINLQEIFRFLNPNELIHYFWKMSIITTARNVIIAQENGGGGGGEGGLNYIIYTKGCMMMLVIGGSSILYLLYTVSCSKLCYHIKIVYNLHFFY